MADKLYFSVVEDYNGEWAVSSFFGKTKAEEKRFALNGSKRCVLVTTDHDEAQRRAEAERRKARQAS